MSQKKGRAAARSRARPVPAARRATTASSIATSRWARWRSSSRRTMCTQSLSRYGLQSPTGLIRMMIQQSNCFIVVERGNGMQNMMQERALQESGELRQNSNMGGGQMVSADFVLTPGRRVLREQCRRRRRRARRTARRHEQPRRRRGRRRPQVQGSADQHAGRGCALGRPGGGGRRQLEEGGSEARRGAVRRRRRRRRWAAMRTRTKAR